MARAPLTEEQKERKRERERERAWSAANKDKVREKNQRYLANHPTVFTDYQEKNKESRREKAKAYIAENMGKVLANARRHYHVRKEKGLKVRGDSVEARKVRTARRRSLLAGQGGKLSGKHVSFLLKAQRGKCANCAANLDTYHLDHIEPLARGGRNEAGNIQLLCPPCNLKKHAKDPFAWANENGRLL